MAQQGRDLHGSAGRDIRRRSNVAFGYSAVQASARALPRRRSDDAKKQPDDHTATWLAFVLAAVLAAIAASALFQRRPRSGLLYQIGLEYIIRVMFANHGIEEYGLSPDVKRFENGARRESSILLQRSSGRGISAMEFAISHRETIA